MLPLRLQRVPYNKHRGNYFIFSVKKTMYLAQSLYEGKKLEKEPVGLITYMRTDSFHLANDAITKAREYIKSKYLEDLPEKPAVFRTKSKSAQEAHEAIRPTDVSKLPDKVKDARGSKLYSLIWKRAVATQGAEARFKRSKVELKNGGALFEANGVRMVFDGFLKISGGKLEDVILPSLKMGDKIIRVGRSTASLTTTAFEELNSQCRRWASMTLDLYW